MRAVRLTRRRRAPTPACVALGIILGAILAASGGAATATTSLAAAPSPKTVAPSQVAFSLALLRNLVGTTGSNLVVSPSSLEVSLSMLELGAKGATEDGIARALSAGSLSPSVLAASFGALRSSLESAKGTELAEADAIFAESGVTPHAPYLAQLRSDFAASLHVVDFEANATEATDAVNNFVAKATKGLIPVLFADPLGPTTKIVLADAVYLHANWETPFPHGATAPAEFHEQSGSTESVPFMNGTVAASYLIRPGLTAVQLPYKGGRLAALVLEPTSGSVANFVSSLLPSTLSSALVALRTASVELSMPKVSLNSAENLNGPLTSLGMGDAFSNGADLSGITASPPLKVSIVRQRATLRIDEAGTTAAAATGIGIAPTAVEAHRVAIDLDRPFVFLVRDTSTGVVLFEALVVNP